MKYVYILRSIANPRRTYTGISGDFRARRADHNAGLSKHTAHFRPWQLVVVLRFENDTRAYAFERYLKSGSGQAFARRHLL